MNLSFLYERQLSGKARAACREAVADALASQSVCLSLVPMQELSNPGAPCTGVHAPWKQSEQPCRRAQSRKAACGHGGVLVPDEWSGIIHTLIPAC